MHTQMKHTLSKSTRFNPYFGRHNYKKHKPAKVGIKYFRFARECVSFLHAWMYVPTQLELCLHDQTQIIANTVLSVEWEASNFLSR